MKLNERQIMLLEKAIECLDVCAGIIGIESIIDSIDLHYDEVDNDMGTLADDLRCEFL